MAGEPKFTFVQLRYFVSAAELGTMTAAAQQLLVAQSAISAAVAHLERELGVQLFIRQHARGLALTAAGERLLHEARGLLSHLSEVAESARGLGAVPAGELFVGCFTTLAPFYLPRLLSDVAEHYPELQLSVVEGEIDELQAALRSGRCEIAVAYDLSLGTDIERELIAVAPPYAILPPEHRLANVAGVRLKNLAPEPMILLDLPHSREYFRSLVATSGIEPRVRYRTSSYETVRALVARGHGFAILNQRPVSDTTYGGGRAVPCPLLDTLPALPVVLARLAGLRPSARAQAFASRCRAVFASEGPCI